MRRAAPDCLRILSILCLVGAGVTPARGQDAPASEPPAERAPVAATGQARAPRLELTVLGGLIGGGDLGDRDAQGLGNQAPASPPASWFATSARIDAAPVLEARLGVRAARRLWIEGGVSYARPEFAVDLSEDIEGAPDVTATSRLTQVLVDASVQYRWAGRRVSPFVLGGAGYLRQLDDTRATAASGWLAQAGGGIVVRLAPDSRGFMRRLGLRGDVRVVWLRDGLIVDGQRSATVSALAGLTVGL